MAEFRHGVYTSEVETALQTAPAVDSALPYVVGASKNSFAPRIISSWRQFVEVSGITEGTDDVAGDDGWHVYSLVSFAYLWFKICGRGDCVMRGIASVDGSLAQGDIISAIGEIDTIYERTRRLPSLIVVPYFGGNSAIWVAMKSKAEKYGGRFRAVAIGDIQCTEYAVSGATPDIISDPADIVDAKTVASESLALFWPYIGIGGMRFDMSSAACAVMNRVDAQNGNLPFVSPSNKNCYATGVYRLVADSEEIPATYLLVSEVGGYVLRVTLTGVTGNGSVHAVAVYEKSGTEHTIEGDYDYVAGVFDMPGADGSVVTYDLSVTSGEYNEEPLFQSRDEVNAYLGANGVIGALNTADGWVLWGNSTTCFPGNTDVKDYMLAIRRMFNYTQNLFQVFAQPRIDNPLNRRQLEGVVNAFNQILASLQGFGALNAASVEIDDERNTTEQLIRGIVYFRIRIAPPPPMQEINGVFEFDVQGFEASLA